METKAVQVTPQTFFRNFPILTLIDRYLECLAFLFTLELRSGQTRARAEDVRAILKALEDCSTSKLAISPAQFQLTRETFPDCSDYLDKLEKCSFAKRVEQALPVYPSIWIQLIRAIEESPCQDNPELLLFKTLAETQLWKKYKRVDDEIIGMVLEALPEYAIRNSQAWWCKYENPENRGSDWLGHLIHVVGRLVDEAIEASKRKNGVAFSVISNQWNMPDDHESPHQIVEEEELFNRFQQEIYNRLKDWDDLERRVVTTYLEHLHNSSAYTLFDLKDEFEPDDLSLEKLSEILEKFRSMSERVLQDQSQSDGLNDN